MATVLGRDTLKLMEDAKKIKQELKKLEKDCRSWSPEREEKDLAELTDTAKNVEVDVSLMLADSISADLHRGEDEKGVLSDELHHVFVNLDALFGDIKEARTELKEGYVYPGSLERLEIDCRRFNKTVQSIENDLGVRSERESPEENREETEFEEMPSGPGQGGIELIRCKRQPGNLLISRYACGRRYLLARENGKRIFNDVFGMVRRSSLEICRTCPEGRIISGVQGRKAASSGKKRMSAERMIRKGSSYRSKDDHVPGTHQDTHGVQDAGS